jgi:serine/threonine protein kinase
MTRFTSGTVIAGYQIRKFIAAGNNGDVYEAVQLSLARPVALKILRPQIADDPDFVRAFIREAQAAAAIQHPAVVQAYDVGRSVEGHLYFAMELVDGVDVSVLLQQRGRIEPSEAMILIRAVAAGLAYGHRSRGLTHGDLKPSNLLINREGQVKLADLGLARMHGEAQAAADGIYLTPQFAAPEVISGTWKTGDPRADMYSLGATLHCLISGSPPFNHGDYRHILTQHQLSPPPHLNALAKKPEQRFQTWEEFLAAADSVISGLTLKVKDPVQQPYKLAACVAGLAILIALMVTTLMISDTQAPPRVAALPVDTAVLSPLPKPPPKPEEDAEKLSAAAAEQLRALAAVRQQVEAESQKKIADLELAHQKAENEAKRQIEAADKARLAAEADAMRIKNQQTSAEVKPLLVNPQLELDAAKAKAKEEAAILKSMALEKAQAQVALARKAVLLKEFSPALEMALNGDYPEALAKLKSSQSEALLRRELTRVVAAVRTLEDKLSVGLFKVREVHPPYELINSTDSTHDILPDRYDNRNKTWRCYFYDNESKRSISGALYISLRNLTSEELQKLMQEEDEAVKTFLLNRFGHYLPLQEDKEAMWLLGQSQSVGYQLWSAIGGIYEVEDKSCYNLYLPEREIPKGSAANFVVSPTEKTHVFLVLEVAGIRNEVWSNSLGKPKKLSTKELSLCPDARSKDRARGLIVEVRPIKDGYELVSHSPAGEKIEGSVNPKGNFNFNGWQIDERFEFADDKLAAKVRSILVNGYQAK